MNSIYDCEVYPSEVSLHDKETYEVSTEQRRIIDQNANDDAVWFETTVFAFLALINLVINFFWLNKFSIGDNAWFLLILLIAGFTIVFGIVTHIFWYIFLAITSAVLIFSQDINLSLLLLIISILIARFMGLIKKYSIVQEESSNMRRHNRAVQTEKEQNLQNKAISEASELSQHVRNVYTNSLSLENSLSHTRAKILLYVQTAKDEYNSNAFTPFWDAIEGAILELDSYIQISSNIIKNRHNYHFLLKDREHNFPSFPVQIEQIPQLSKELQAIHEVVRLGETNYQFAIIWEHRKTRSVIMDGFYTINARIQSFEKKFEQVIYKL